MFIYCTCIVRSGLINKNYVVGATLVNIISTMHIRRQSECTCSLYIHVYICMSVECEFSCCRQDSYRIYSRISRPAYKPTPIPTTENLEKMVTRV